MEHPLRRYPLPERRGDERPLHLDAPKVGCCVAGAEARDLHGLLAVQMLPPGLQIDIQPLRGVRVVHIDRHIERDAAHQIDQLLKHAQIDHGVAVRLKADDLRHAQQQLLHPGLSAAGPAVGGVDLRDRILAVDQRVARDGDEMNGLFRAVNVQQQHGVGTVAALVRACDEDGRAAFFAGGKRGLALRCAGDQKMKHRRADRQQQNQHQRNAQSVPPLRLFRPSAPP